MLIVFHCRQTFIKDADGTPYILIVFASISGFTLVSRISFTTIFQAFKTHSEIFLKENFIAVPDMNARTHTQELGKSFTGTIY